MFCELVLKGVFKERLLHFADVADAQGGERRADEAFDKMVHGDVRVGAKKNGVWHAEVAFEQFDGLYDGLRLARAWRLKPGQYAIE